jgi:serine/threonine protein kinase
LAKVCEACRSIVVEQATFCPHCGRRLPEIATAGSIAEGTVLSVENWAHVVLGKKIGEGGMGIVYRGQLDYRVDGPRAGQPGHPVAVKALHPLLQGRPKARQLFIAEANALSMLAHPNIVMLHGLAEHFGQQALVMELVLGRPLDTLLEERVAKRQRDGEPCVPLQEAWHYFTQLLGALASVHALSMVHRDIKPSNLLLRPDRLIKLTDFGIARLPADAVSTTGGMAPGTGAYMAPEQVLARDLDGRADLYSAAIVLYELLTGRTPFEEPGRNEIQLRAAQVEAVPPPVTRWLKGAPPVLDVLMARALAKNPDLRYPSATRLAEVFADALSLPLGAGWLAQKRLADNAEAISRSGQGDGGVPQPQAEALRTAVMQGFGA